LKGNGEDIESDGGEFMQPCDAWMPGGDKKAGSERASE
jgi:hypothetical protein